MIDLKKLEANLLANDGSTLVAQHHICLWDSPLQILAGKLLAPGILPAHYEEMSPQEKLDHLFCFYLPWYLRFFRSWTRPG